LQPVAGAEVFWIDEHAEERVQAQHPRERADLQFDVERTTRRFGWRTRSAADGTARVHLGWRRTNVIARHGGRSGHLLVRRGDAHTPEDLVVRLREDRTLRVRVLDAAGAPAANVPLLVERPRQGAEPERISRIRRTDGDGLAMFGNLPAERTAAQGLLPGEPPDRYRVRIPTPGLDLAPTVLDAHALPTEPVEIHLPATGHLHVRLVCAGQTVPEPWILTFYPAPKGAGAPERRSIDVWRDDAGWARLDHVPLGRAFAVAARGSQGSTQFEVRGPTAPGQLVARDLDLADAVVAFTGRALTSAGDPVVNGNLSVRWQSGSTWRSERVATDPGGRFVWILGDRVADEARTGRLVLAHDPGDATPERATLEATARSHGVTDLGEVRLAVEPLVVAGHIVSAAATLGALSVHVERQAEGAEAGASDWHRASELLSAAFRDGRFEVRGQAERGRYRLRVDAEGHAPIEPIEFAPGTTDLVIELQTGTRLRATLLLPDGLDARHLRVSLRPSRDATTAAHPTANQVLRAVTGAAREFYWRAVPAGHYTLCVETRGFAEPLFTLPDVVIPPPPDGDPRLRDVDLSAVLATLRVRTSQDTDLVAGPAPHRAFAFPQPQPIAGEWEGFDLGENGTLLPVPRRPFDLLVTHRGARPVLLRSPTGEVTVHLAPWPRVDLRFVGHESLPANVHLRVALAPASAESGNYLLDAYSGSLASLLGPSRRAVTVVDGRAALSVGDSSDAITVRLQLGDDGPSRELRDVSPAAVVTGPPVTVRLSPEEIRGVVEAMRRAPKK
ncbi:MAG: hypothetical protein ABL997_16550, partial [Planctomycetota bacterium]